MDGRGMGERSPFYLKDRIAMDFLHVQRGNISENRISYRVLVLSQGKGGVSSRAQQPSIA